MPWLNHLKNAQNYFNLCISSPDPLLQFKEVESNPCAVDLCFAMLNPFLECAILMLKSEHLFWSYVSLI